MQQSVPLITKRASVIGDFRQYVANPLDYLVRKQKLHGEIFRYRVATRELISLNNPDHIQYVLQENYKNYNKGLAYKRLGLLLGNGILTSDGSFWLKNRRLAQPLFHKERIESYAQVMREEVDLMLSEWKKRSHVSLTGEMTKLTLSIISRSLLGLDLEQRGSVIQRYLPQLMREGIKRITSPISVPLWLPTRTNRQFRQGIRTLKGLIKAMIHEKEAKKGNDLLSHLLEARDDEGNTLSGQQLEDEIMTFFLAGHETTAVAAFWAIYELESNPAVKEDFQRALQSDNQEYIKALINEVLRYHSPIWAVSRIARGDDQIGEYQIRKGSSVIFSPYVVHRLPEYWEDPDTFNPKRFLSGEPRHKFSYFPFGGGPRVCIGNHFALMELEIILRRIYENIDLELLDDSFPGFDYSLTLRPGSDRQAKVTLRPAF
ncbi:MAG: cytochrome P450 [Bacteroidota bacterium]